MKKVIFAAMMALSCTFAFAGTNPVQPETQPVVAQQESEQPEKVIVILSNGSSFEYDNGCAGTSYVDFRDGAGGRISGDKCNGGSF